MEWQRVTWKGGESGFPLFLFKECIKRKLTENEVQEMKNTIKEICKKYPLYQD